MASQVELTPCGAMFDIFKRAAHLSHIELCGLVLSSRPLADGRSPQSRAADRSWVSRFIVRAPVGTLQQRYFAEYGTSAARIMSQLALRQRNPMDSTAVINMVCGPAGEPMVRALEECHRTRISIATRSIACPRRRNSCPPSAPRPCWCCLSPSVVRRMCGPR